MKLINLNLRDDLIEQLDSAVKYFGFSNRSEFIRSVIRDKLEEYRMKKAIMELSRKRGSMKGKGFTDTEYEEARKEAFEELYNQLQ
jgi:Arc/MetJ-type ribon-helix-helix transcriptional regulator